MSFIGGMDLTKSASQVVNAKGSSFSDYAPYLVLVALVLITGYFQQRQTMRNQTTPNPQMAIISKVFPIVFGFISWGLLSGVVLYFFTSNLWQIGQQEVVLRTIGSAAGPPPKKGSKPEVEGSDAATRAALVEGGATGKRQPPGSKSAGSKSASPRSPNPRSKGTGGKPGAGGGAKAGGGKAGGKPDGTTNGSGQTGAPNGARSNRKRKR